jgi:hypothetical protein
VRDGLGPLAPAALDSGEKGRCSLSIRCNSQSSPSRVTRPADGAKIDSHRTKEEIDIVVNQIRRLARTASLEFALRVGAVIVHSFYEGNANTWRSRGPKTSSFRMLSQHPNLPMSPGALYRCVALYELCDRLEAPSRWEHLSASHLRAVLGLPEATQERMLTAANANRWTVRALHEAVLRAKSDRVTTGGRRAEPPLARSLRTVVRSIEEHRIRLEHRDELSSADLERSRCLVREARASLERLRQSLDTLDTVIPLNASRN